MAKTIILNSPFWVLFLISSTSFTCTVLATNSAYPTTPAEVTDPTTSCGPYGGGRTRKPLRQEVYGNGRVYDISHRISNEMPTYVDHAGGVGKFLWLTESMKNGSISNLSEVRFSVHTGTHVDTPAHVFDHYYDAGFDADALDLDVMNGPGMVVDVPRDKNITAEVLESLNIAKGVRRVLFRTLNTDRGLMYKKEFDTSYVGFTEEGARWLVENTDIRLVGTDYLPIAAYDHLLSAHLVLLESTEIVVVEAVKLDHVPAGIYSIHCLPLRLAGAEGSPTRCILIRS
ncbi:kynurenine formamidase-like [Melia azedarach]|uniref:Kynurenine formamidase-like n=1 Tax=Melia azedarach TaxID=155640 RepID=A0ACC1Y001_MELAZ|nr:kynurenine formamidase-like [Melia azedarach]